MTAIYNMNKMEEPVSLVMKDSESECKVEVVDKRKKPRY